MKTMFLRGLCLILLALAGAKASAQTFEADGINYHVLSEEEGTVEVTSGDYSGDVVIPSEVNHAGSTYRVTTIGFCAFNGCSALTSVEMPSVTTINASAFSACYALISVSMPEVTMINANAFNGCSALTSVEIPASCTYIGSYTFAGCTALKEIVVDENNPNYSSSDDALYNKNKNILISWPAAEGDINLPLSVTQIGDGTFNGCYALTSVEMPAVTTIGDEAFNCCYALASVDMPAVTTIGRYVFSYCSSLTSVDIPASCTSIGIDPFYDCKLLIEITVDENNPNYSSRDGVLYDKNVNTLIIYPTGKSSIDIPSSVMTIGDHAFCNCDNLTLVEMPSVTTIGDHAFSGCDNLTLVEMPLAATIGDRAFYGCYALTSVEMSAVTTIGDEAFNACEALTSVHIPASCTSIVGNSFQECKSLEEIVVDENNPNYSSMDGVLYDKYMSTLIACPGKKSSIDMSSSVTTIGDGAFFSCWNLTSVSMPSVTTIGDEAFFSCWNLTSVSMPSVTTIGYGAFRYCSALISVNLPTSVAMIGDYAFDGCISLTSVYCGTNRWNVNRSLKMRYS